MSEFTGGRTEAIGIPIHRYADRVAGLWPLRSFEPTGCNN
jgi:hypothetical protein